MELKDYYARRIGETASEYKYRICSYREECGIGWQKVADILNAEFGVEYTPDGYRKWFDRHGKQVEKNLVDEGRFLHDDNDLESNIDTADIIKERMKLADERNAVKAMYRRISREETLKEIAKEACQNIQLKDLTLKVKPQPYENSACEAILCISDWHYGIEIDNYFNKYNPSIAKKRIEMLTERTIEYIKSRKINKLHVINLGDLISGNIHLPLRINNRLDVITQIIEVSELVAQMLFEFSKYTTVVYGDVLDNHSRVTAKISDSLDLESFARLTKWYLKVRLPEIEYIENVYADDIVTFEILGHKICGVHGHKDKQNKLIDNLTVLTQNHFDMILSAHLHHFSADEKNDTLLISNASLMGTDEYALSLRLNGSPSQNMIIVTKECVAKEILRILV